MKKRLLPALLALAMVLTMLPLAAFADVTEPPKYQDCTLEQWLNDMGAADTAFKAAYTEDSGKLTSRSALFSVWANLPGIKAILAGENVDADSADTTQDQKDAAAMFATLTEDNKNQMKAWVDFYDGITKLDLSALDTKLANMGTLSIFPGLTYLDFSGNKVSANNVLPELTLWNTITTLKLNNCGVTDINALDTTKNAGVQSTIKAVNLTTLELSGNTELDSIAALGGCTALTTLKLNGCTALADASPVAELSDLETLDISGTSVTSTAFLRKDDAVAHRSLEVLNLSGLDLSGWDTDNNRPTGISGLAFVLENALANSMSTVSWNLTDVEFPVATNEQKAHVNKLLADAKTAGVAITGVDEDDESLKYEITSKLTGLTVTDETDGVDDADKVALSVIPAVTDGTYDYVVEVPAAVKKVNLAPTAAGCEVIKVLYNSGAGGTNVDQGTVQDALTVDLDSLTLIKDEINEHITVTLVVAQSNETDRYDRAIYTIKLQRPAVVAETYTIKFAAAEQAEGTKEDVKVTKAATGDTEYILPADASGFTAPKGKEFDKWTVEGEGLSIAAGKLVIASDYAGGDITLTATWKSKKLDAADNVQYTAYADTDEEYKQWFSGHLKLTGLENNCYYLIQLGSPNGTNRVYQVQQASAGGEIDLIAQKGAKLWVALIGESNTDLTAGLAGGWILGGSEGLSLTGK